MRAALARVYLAAGLAAAFFLALIGVIVVAQIVARMWGVLIPSADEFAAYCMAAASFLGLPYALHHGDHIRVVLLLQHLPARLRRVCEVGSTAVGFGLAAYFSWQVALFVHETFTLGEVSTGLVPIPMSIPQSAMLVGTLLLAVAFLERLLSTLAGSPEEAPAEGALTE